MNLMTLREAADALGVAHTTLAVQARAGRLRAKKVGPLWLVSQREVERYRQVSKGRPGRRSKGQDAIAAGRTAP